MPRPAVPFRLRPGADKYYTRQDILDLVTFSRYTLFRKLKEKSMVMPVPTVEGLDYPYHLWRRDEFDQWLKDNPSIRQGEEAKGWRTRSPSRIQSKRDGNSSNLPLNVPSNLKLTLNNSSRQLPSTTPIKF